MPAVYIITRFLTFPGAMIRGFWEHMVCRIYGVPVEDNRLIRRDEMSSHIEHELFPTASGAFAIGFIPAFMNAFLAFLLTIPSVLCVFVFEMSGTLVTVVGIISYWLAFSLYVNSYPTVEDALNMKEKVYKQGGIIKKILYAPGFLGCYVGAYAEKYCITFLLAVVGMFALIFGF
ncbi:MAG: hypothetical protein NC122_01645 [Faecalibacterium sp.]|nr:hypothetical protein [Ruminococcus sp.]MCM1391329.1 hypothetical protein [Ruminococcus sp.]MCM1484888.1 hypothetical protein [Faecalibacterium sp.]